MTAAAASRWAAVWPRLALVALATLVAVAAHLGAAPIVVVAAVLQAVLLAAWASTVEVPSPRTFLAVGAVASVAADVAVVLARGDRISPLAGVLALTVLGGFAAELARRDGRHALVLSLTSTVTASAIAVLVASLPAARPQPEGPQVLAAAAAAAAAAGLVVALPLRGWLCAVLGAAAGTAVGVAAALGGGLARSDALVVAAATALAACVGGGLARIAAARGLALLAVLPLACMAPIGYAVGRVVGG